LSRGVAYRVTASFLDADGDDHHVGEKWTFRGSWFSKFDDEITLFIVHSDDSHGRIPLLWKPNAQGEVIEDASRFLVPASRLICTLSRIA
jgi:hypothetical protein